MVVSCAEQSCRRPVSCTPLPCSVCCFEEANFLRNSRRIIPPRTQLNHYLSARPLQSQNPRALHSYFARGSIIIEHPRRETPPPISIHQGMKRGSEWLVSSLLCSDAYLELLSLDWMTESIIDKKNKLIKVQMSSYSAPDRVCDQTANAPYLFLLQSCNCLAIHSLHFVSIRTFRVTDNTSILLLVNMTRSQQHMCSQSH